MVEIKESAAQVIQIRRDSFIRAYGLDCNAARLVLRFDKVAHQVT